MKVEWQLLNGVNISKVGFVNLEECAMSGMLIPSTLVQPVLYFAKWIGKDILVRSNVFWIILARRETEVKIKKESSEDKLNHIGCQKSSRA